MVISAALLQNQHLFLYVTAKISRIYWKSAVSKGRSWSTITISEIREPAHPLEPASKLTNFTWLWTLAALEQSSQSHTDDREKVHPT